MPSLVPGSAFFGSDGKSGHKNLRYDPKSECDLVQLPGRGGGGGVLLGILGGGVLSGSPNPYPILDQKMFFPRPVFRPDL